MKKLKKFVFKHKYLLLISFVLVIFLGTTIYGISLLMPNRDESLYGGRLEGIENYPISDAKLNEVSEEILEKEFVIEASASISGRIINFIIYVEEDTDLLIAKNVSEVLLESFSDEEKGFYDMQIFLTTKSALEREEVKEEQEDVEEEIEVETPIFPKMGYKHTSSRNFVWSN